MDILRLDEKERRILSAVQLQAHASLPELSQQIGIRQHVIHYYLRQLREHGVIHPRPMTDVHRMGFTQYSVFLTPHFENMRAKSSLLRFLIQSEFTSDIFELGGDYQYGFVLTVVDLEEVYQFLNRLSQLPGVALVDKSISIRISTTLFRRVYLGPYKGGPKHITYRRSSERVSLDPVDHAILRGMHQMPDASFRELARTLEMPHSTVAKRIRAMEESGAILGYVYGISSHRYGMEAYRLIVHTKGFDYNAWEQLFHFSMKHPQILCLFQCIGSWDYEFEVEVEDRTLVAGIVQEIREFLGASVISIRTLPLFAFPKSTGYPFSKKWDVSTEREYIQ